MQILKMDVRNRIMESALIEFSDMGFDKSSLRHIAKLSGITVGNIYAYFKDKNTLLDAVLEPILEDVNHLIDDITSRQENTESYLQGVAEGVVLIYKKYQRQITILMNLMGNEKYGIYRSKITDSVADALYDHIDSVNDKKLAHIIAISVIAGIVTCLNDTKDLRNDEAILLVYNYLYFMFHVKEVV